MPLRTLSRCFKTALFILIDTKSRSVTKVQFEQVLEHLKGLALSCCVFSMWNILWNNSEIGQTLEAVQSQPLGTTTTTTLGSI